MLLVPAAPCCWSLLPRACSQFMSLVEGLNYLQDKKGPGCKDMSDVPGRMLVLHHAWYLLNKHPNMQLDSHAASAVTKVCVRERESASLRPAGWVYSFFGFCLGVSICYQM